MILSTNQMTTRFLACLLLTIFTVASTGCGSKSESAGAAGSSEAQGKMTPEDVQKELQKLSPPAGKSKAKAK